MSGVLIVGALLHAYAPLLAVVPAARIKAEELPLDTALPALLVQEISLADRPILSPGATRRVSERVQVTAYARTIEERTNVLRLVRLATADRTGTIGGFDAVAVLLAGAGPRFKIEGAGIYLRSQDLSVSYLEPTA